MVCTTTLAPSTFTGYTNEFSGRHNYRPLGTMEQITSVIGGMNGKRLRFADLIA